MPDMRFAPAPVLLAQKGAAGLNQTNVRSHNERLLLDLLRREKTLSRFEIGQRSNLSAQTVSVLVRALLAEGLLIEGEVHRGRIGPPTTPFSLNPDGAFAIGIYAGIRVIDICCLDFCGELRHSRRLPLPDGADVVTEARDLCASLLEACGESIRESCLGIGIALNRAHWPQDPKDEEIGVIEEAFASRFRLPCYMLNDVTSAATGEVLFGQTDGNDRFAFVHIGMNTTVRVVLNGQAQAPNNESLLPLPGLSKLVGTLEENGLDCAGLWADGSLPDGAETPASDWISEVAGAVSGNLIVLLSILDLRSVVLVAPFEQDYLDALIQKISDILKNEGIEIPASVGHNARFAKASGAASSVLSTRFSPDWQQ